VLVWVSACFNCFVFMLLTLLAWLLCVAVFLSVAILFLPVSWSDGLRSAVGVFLPICLPTCSLVAWVSPCWIAVFCRIICLLLACCGLLVVCCWLLAGYQMQFRLAGFVVRRCLGVVLLVDAFLVG